MNQQNSNNTVWFTKIAVITIVWTTKTATIQCESQKLHHQSMNQQNCNNTVWTTKIASAKYYEPQKVLLLLQYSMNHQKWNTVAFFMVNKEQCFTLVIEKEGNFLWTSVNNFLWNWISWCGGFLHFDTIFHIGYWIKKVIFLWSSVNNFSVGCWIH